MPDGATGLHFFVAPSPLATNSLPPAPLLRFIGVYRSPAGAVTFTWQAGPGRLYRLEAKDRLDDATWTPLSGPAPATSETVSFIESVGAQRQRFYRVTQMD